jgi:RNase H-fold protein (predicted Holliday junction resolvase)
VGESAEKAVAFAEKLRSSVSCEVRTGMNGSRPWRRTRSLREAGKSTRQTRGYVDQVAAQIFLQSYLDSLELNQGGRAPEPLA